MTMKHGNRQSGFTLVEIALGLLLFTLVGYWVLKMITNFFQIEKERVTIESVELARKNLLSFAQVNGYLPCPDAGNANDGIEDRKADGNCLMDHGRLPWKTIGAKPDDGFGNPIYYRVVPDVVHWTRNPCSKSGSAAFGLSGDFSIKGAQKMYYCASNGRIACFEPGEISLPNRKTGFCPPDGSGLKTIVNGDSTNNSDEVSYADIMYNAQKWKIRKLQPPYIFKTSQPLGEAGVSDDMLSLWDESFVDGETDEKARLDANVIAVVGSFGKENSGNVWKELGGDGVIISPSSVRCPVDVPASGELKKGRQMELENCDADKDFVMGDQKGFDDYFLSIDINDVKHALIRGGKL